MNWEPITAKDIQLVGKLRWPWLLNKYCEIRHRILCWFAARNWNAKCKKALEDWERVTRETSEAEMSDAVKVLGELPWYESAPYPVLMYRKYLPTMARRRKNKKPPAFRRVS